MKLLSLFKPAAISISFLTCWLLSAITVSAAQYEENASGQDYLYVKGLVHTVSIADQSLTLKQKKGPRLTVIVTPATEYAGFSKLEDLELRQTLKAWYRPKKDGNHALKLEKIPDTGC